MPQITIIIPTYNRANIIPRTLASVAAQSFLDWECIIVDDFSTDNTKEIVEQLCKKDSRFMFLINEEKKGAQGARNTGLKHARYDWVQFFDSDDIMHEDLLDIIEKEIDTTNEQYDVYTCHSNIINTEDGAIVGAFQWVSENDIHAKLLCGETYIDYNGAIIRKEKLFEIGGLDENCLSMQEWDTHIRLSKVAKYHTIPKILIDYYIGGSDTISADSKREIIGYIYLFNKHFSEWTKNKSSYKIYGERVINLIDQLPNQPFKKEYSQKVFKLVPGLRWYLFFKRKKQQYKSIRHNVAKIIKLLIKNGRTN